jgi:hypothetical protein
MSLSIYPSIYLSIYRPLLGLGRFFSFLNFYTVGRTPWTGDEPVALPLPAHTTEQTQNKRTQTSMPQVGFEPTIPVFERAKTVHVLDRTAIVIGKQRAYYFILRFEGYSSSIVCSQIQFPSHRMHTESSLCEAYKYILLEHFRVHDC